MKYLITGATGNIGAKVVDLLVARGERPRVFVRDAGKARWRFGNRVDIFAGDLGSRESLTAALEGIEEFFLLNSGPQIPFRDELAASAAKVTGVKHLVKLSSIDVQHGLAIGAWHERGEAAIRASGVPFTFVQPTGFMSNLLAWAPSIKAEGVVRSSTSDGRRAFIHSDDIAAVAVATLTNHTYDGESLPITGPEALSFAEVTEKIGATIGKPVAFHPISDEEARERYSRVSDTTEETEAHVALWRAIRDGRLATVNNNVKCILGRSPITLDQWLVENADAFCQSSTNTITSNPEIGLPGAGLARLGF